MHGEAGCYFLDSREARGESAQTNQSHTKIHIYIFFSLTKEDNKEPKAHKWCTGLICSNTQNKKEHKWSSI